MRCPACLTMTMEPFTDESVELEIDTCTNCGGLWFDADELSAFLKSDAMKDRFLWVDVDDPPERVGGVLDIIARTCPRDRMVMQEETYGGITVDRCPQCKGLWFDEGEVRLVVDRYQRRATKGDLGLERELREGLEPAPPEQPRRGLLPGLLAFARHVVGRD